MNNKQITLAMAIMEYWERHPEYDTYVQAFLGYIREVFK